jgi:hypothetical protein
VLRCDKRGYGVFDVRPRPGGSAAIRNLRRRIAAFLGAGGPQNAEVIDKTTVESAMSSPATISS